MVPVDANVCFKPKATVQAKQPRQVIHKTSRIHPVKASHIVNPTLEMSQTHPPVPIQRIQLRHSIWGSRSGSPCECPSRFHGSWLSEMRTVHNYRSRTVGECCSASFDKQVPY